MPLKISQQPRSNDVYLKLNGEEIANIKATKELSVEEIQEINTLLKTATYDAREKILAFGTLEFNLQGKLWKMEEILGTVQSYLGNKSTQPQPVSEQSRDEHAESMQFLGIKERAQRDKEMHQKTKAYESQHGLVTDPNEIGAARILKKESGELKEKPGSPIFKNLSRLSRKTSSGESASTGASSEEENTPQRKPSKKFW